MTRTKIIRQVLEVPAGAMIKVADILIEESILHEIIATDEESDTLKLEIDYVKEQRDAVRAIENIISDYEEEQEEDDDDEEDEDD